MYAFPRKNIRASLLFKMDLFFLPSLVDIWQFNNTKLVFLSFSLQECYAPADDHQTSFSVVIGSLKRANEREKRQTRFFHVLQHTSNRSSSFRQWASLRRDTHKSAIWVVGSRRTVTRLFLDGCHLLELARFEQPLIEYAAGPSSKIGKLYLGTENVELKFFLKRLCLKRALNIIYNLLKLS